MWVGVTEFETAVFPTHKYALAAIIMHAGQQMSPRVAWCCHIRVLTICGAGGYNPVHETDAA